MNLIATSFRSGSGIVQPATTSRAQDGGAYCGAAVGGKCMVSKAKLVIMNLLCSGMVGFGLRQNLGTTEKGHPSPTSSPSEGQRGTVVLLQSDRKQMVPFTFTDEER